ncbi:MULTISPECIES: RNA polymerase sigma factor FliA [Paraglaciecola]|uniref:RNA polymerase sigma factor FliA n=4 Tax=Paraglaciecola TaxID=1621534 RepID=A0A8H9I8T8_9ALTE|nr:MULTISPECIES: RNA polymerase sigma factor FliA [Paraglaciecola]AEE22259.1 RNA polymerase, sigma 28 subunit, FliA/WhiG [Glaciecola sp. 4H-3-7+YE-5]MBN27964.1 RNA polymerase sigma factor FliA [Alteromonadaceae bacterium]MBJ2135912.1 RNA polymerase sigma factor FliA [Paraglaciecola chathamensis]MBU3017257.1 RNA polymerase sigma factor FliA [Paraglaciecola agarilytica]MDO6558225.1 RNA polymerase sigma factor FliA [Paraglaciecola chathamensis]
MNSKAAAYQQLDDRNALVERHAPLVKRIAHHLIARLPASVLVDDLIQAGMIGLLEASRNFDGSKGASFETFAGIRIRGSMLDEIRKGDWTPRSVHKNGRAITDAINKVERETGRDARDVDIAKKLEVSIEQYHQMLSEVNAGKIIGMEDLGVTEDVVTTEQTKGSDTPFEDLLQGSFQKALAHAITTLPEREAIVLSLYYDEELNLREIGEVLDVSESRVSQIHSQAMLKLKSKMQTWRIEE